MASLLSAPRRHKRNERLDLPNGTGIQVGSALLHCLKIASIKVHFGVGWSFDKAQALTRDREFSIDITRCLHLNNKCLKIPSIKVHFIIGWIFDNGQQYSNTQKISSQFLQPSQTISPVGVTSLHIPINLISHSYFCPLSIIDP